VAKTQFLTNMSHELRTPLNGVLGVLQLLETPDISTPYDEYARIALRAGRSLLDLINDVLDFSRIESGALRMVSINLDLRELLEEVVASWGIQAANKGLILSCAVPADLPRVLRGDPLRLRQVLSNLIGNAVKFTERGTVEIAVTVIEQGQSLRFEVIDTGIGMSSASQQKVLEPFSQHDGSIARDFSGIGLGLAISRELVACMNGSLQLESTLGEGTRVWFELPLEYAAAESGADKEAPAVNFIGRVLVVDDEEINRVVAVAMLQRLGLVVQAVDGASSALKALHEDKFDLILMDVRMPNTDGYEATRLLRAGWGERCPPVVAMTAYVTPEDRERAKLAGMIGYLIKPLTVESLTASLCHWLPLAPPQPSAGPAMSFRAGDEPLSPLKLDELREHFDDDGLRTLFATFTASLQQLHGEFEKALAEAQWRRLGEVAASIKGISENVGAYRLCALAARMERAAKAENAAESRASLGFMAALSAEFKDAVRAQFDTEPDAVGLIEATRH
jgi:CheY-like chemotaxis protein